jgi:DNA-binding MarR family transcriptional regulator
MSTFLDEPRTRDAHAHGDTTLVCVSKESFRTILSNHIEFYDALLRLQAQRIRQIYGLVEDLNTLPLRARLAKQLMHLSRSYGLRTHDDPQEIRIGLQLVQEELAQLLGASRQRVNQELKRMEREDCIRVEPSGLVVRDSDALLAIVNEGCCGHADGTPAARWRHSGVRCLLRRTPVRPGPFPRCTPAWHRPVQPTFSRRTPAARPGACRPARTGPG